MTILDEIFDAKRQDAHDRARLLGDFRLQAGDAPTPRGFARALRAALHEPALIAEVKKASPVTGMIRNSFDPAAIARSYERSGADCLSVLTDENYFQGSTQNLLLCRDAAAIPILRKDFTAGELHIYEARAMGADAVLLIVHGLDSVELKEYRCLAESLGMDVLVEAHTGEEAEAAIESGATLVGINNRDLETFKVDLETSRNLLPQLKGRAFLVSESALRSRSDVCLVADAGADAVLIGTAFCASGDIEAGVRSVMPWSG